MVRTDALTPALSHREREKNRRHLTFGTIGSLSHREREKTADT
ncbi:hypothetical protein GCM10011445_40000 [Pseudocitrobacter faecalis]|nr:hypothetical protein GCM10011445_40000 [Pseudocitrobacter faecalis]